MMLLVAALAFALDNAAIEEADALYDNDEPQAAFDILQDALGTATNGAERAEVLWRMSRATLDIGEKQEDRNLPEDTVLATYEEGEQYGIQAIEADPDNHLGYYWQSANIGKWGQLKGILNSLFKAGPMRDLLRQAITVDPEHADSYYVLGQLYEQVPGGIISFGNKDWAVSLGRLAVDLHDQELASGERDELNHDFYIQLAAHLIARDWDQNKRSREQAKKEDRYNDTNDILERGWYYEGVVDIPRQDDKEEAEQILRRMVTSLEGISDRSDGQNRQLDEARELLAEL
jgi:tetratricopeptide (TPR) repeat protein